MQESERSQAARDAAARLGEVEGSSYTTSEGEPVSWAFDIAGDGHRIILAGAAATQIRVALLASADDAFTAMVYGKALASNEALLKPHTVVLLQPPPEAGWYCDQFYLTDDVLPGMDQHDLVAVALHAAEYGPDAEQARDAALSRDYMSTRDPREGEPQFRDWGRLVRALRRYRRLVELEAPEMILENDRVRVAELASAATFAPLPDDIAELAADLGVPV